MKSPVAQWGWQVGQGGPWLWQAPSHPSAPHPQQRIIPQLQIQETALHTLHKSQQPTGVTHVSGFCQCRQRGKGACGESFHVVSLAAGFIHRGFWMCINVAGTDQVWRNKHVPSIQSHQEQSSFILHSTATHSGSKHKLMQSIYYKQLGSPQKQDPLSNLLHIPSDKYLVYRCFSIPRNLMQLYSTIQYILHFFSVAGKEEILGF